MPAPSRAERRRANTRSQGTNKTPRTPITPTVADSAIATTTLEAPAEIIFDAPAPTPAPASTSSRAVKRLRNRSAPEPVDYSKDYKNAASDLRLISIWSGLLFVGMAVLYIAHLNGMF